MCNMDNISESLTYEALVPLRQETPARSRCSGFPSHALQPDQLRDEPPGFPGAVWIGAWRGGVDGAAATRRTRRVGRFGRDGPGAQCTGRHPPRAAFSAAGQADHLSVHERRPFTTGFVLSLI